MLVALLATAPAPVLAQAQAQHSRCPTNWASLHSRGHSERHSMHSMQSVHGMHGSPAQGLAAPRLCA